MRRELRRVSGVLAVFAAVALTGSALVVPEHLRDRHLRERGVTVTGTLTGGTTSRRMFSYRYLYGGVEFTGEGWLGPDRSPAGSPRPVAGGPVIVTLDPHEPSNAQLGDPRSRPLRAAPARTAVTAIGIAAVLCLLYLLGVQVLGLPGWQVPPRQGGWSLPPASRSRVGHRRRRRAAWGIAVAVALAALVAVGVGAWAGWERFTPYLDAWLGR